MKNPATGKGAAIKSVDAGGQAEATGKINAGQLITHVNGTDVTGMSMKEIAPIIKDLAADYDGRIKVVKVNVDESPQTAQRYEARSIPMLLFMRNGELVDTVVGAQPEHVLRDRIEALGARS